MAKKCPKCQHENPDDTIYCGKCATPLKSPADISVTKTLETPLKGLDLGSTFASRYQNVVKNQGVDLDPRFMMPFKYQSPIDVRLGIKFIF